MANTEEVVKRILSGSSNVAGDKIKKILGKTEKKEKKEKMEMED